MTLTFTYCDEAPRVIRAVYMAQKGREIINGLEYENKIRDFYEGLDIYTIIYKIETDNGVLAGFFYYNTKSLAIEIYLREPFDNVRSALRPKVFEFISSGEYEFYILIEDFDESTSPYTYTKYLNTNRYNPDDYKTIRYSLTKLEHKERTIRAVILERGTNIITLGANGNVVEKELNDFNDGLQKYRILYKIETLQGVLVGFFGGDYCFDDIILALRRPFLFELQKIKVYLDTFLGTGEWKNDLLKIEPCAPQEIPCYFYINDCFLTINGCAAIVSQKPFQKRFF